MDTLKKHELFEMEVLERLNSARVLDPLVFGGGTMLRLCYELNRYSVDLDFWFIKQASEEAFFKKVRDTLKANYELTDSAIKFHTLLFEMRSGDYPRRLKIEIRKGVKDCDYEERIAFSKYGTKQVVLNVHTLEQTMKNKVEAAISRKEARDYFDIEFLLRRGIALPDKKEDLIKLKKAAGSFTRNDLKTGLGPILDPTERKYYTENGFALLLSKLESALTSIE